MRVEHRCGLLLLLLLLVFLALAQHARFCDTVESSLLPHFVTLQMLLHVV